MSQDSGDPLPLEAIALVSVDGSGRARLRPSADVLADVERVREGRVVLEGSLGHPELPSAVARLVARGCVPWLAVGDERISRAIASKLRDLGVVGIEVVLEGEEARHDRRHGAGSWRARAGSLRAAHELGLHTRADVWVDAAAVERLPELLPLVVRLARDVVLVDRGLSALQRERVIAASARVDGVQLVGFGLHGPSAASGPVPLDGAVWHALERGVRLPRTEAGTLVGAGGAALAQKAGGMAALGLRLDAMGAPALDLPWCLGGRGQAAAPARHAAACARCGVRDRCAGISVELGAEAAAEVGPRRAWQPLRAGAHVHLSPLADEVMRELALPALRARLASHGCALTEGESVPPESDLVVTWAYPQALDVIDTVPLRDDARVVIFDLHMLREREPIRARIARGGWPDERLEIVSAFPSFAHLYVRTGIPLSRIRWRPYPLGPVPPQLAGEAAFAGGAHARHWGLLLHAAEILGDRCPRIRVASRETIEPVAGIEPLGFIKLPAFLQEVATARFVVLPIEWQRDLCAGGSVLALALAFGRATVATRVPMALDHLRDGVDSLLVDPEDPRALASAIARMASDDALRARLEAGARRRARTLSAAHFADELVLGAPPDADLGMRPWP